MCHARLPTPALLVSVLCMLLLTYKITVAESLLLNSDKFLHCVFINPTRIINFIFTHRLFVSFDFGIPSLISVMMHA